MNTEFEPIQTGAERIDWFLQYLAVLVDDTQELSLAVTLQVGGLLVSGQLVNEKSYFESFADDVAATSTLDPEDRSRVREVFATLGNADHQSAGDRASHPSFLHLKDARFFNAQGSPLSSAKGALWRGRVSEVNGFMMGAPVRRAGETHALGTPLTVNGDLANLDILEFTQDAIFVWEMRGEGILYWNRAAENLYGFTRNEAVGNTSHVLLKTQVPGGMHAVEEQLSRYGVWGGTLQHTGRNGGVVPVQARLSLLSQRNGRLLVIEVNRGISAEHRVRTDGNEKPGMRDSKI